MLSSNQASQLSMFALYAQQVERKSGHKSPIEKIFDALVKIHAFQSDYQASMAVQQVTCSIEQDTVRYSWV